MKSLMLPAILIISCGWITLANESPSKPQENTMPQSTNGNFVLYVSNQSHAMSPVDITVCIDGKQAVSADFDFGNAHNLIKHTFQLAPGKHTLSAATRKGEVQTEQEIEVTDKHWAVIMFWLNSQTGQKKFSVKIQDKPLAFM
jgi:hypothetical protein